MVGSGVVTVADGALVGGRGRRAGRCCLARSAALAAATCSGVSMGVARWLDDAPGWGARWLARGALAAGGGAGWRLTHGKALLDEQAPPPGGDGMSGG